jgi:hypothetical protein
MKNEPVLTAAVIVALGGAIVGLLVAFGVPITEEQRDAIERFLIIVAPIVLSLAAGLAVRQAVTPNAKIVEREVDGTVLAGPANELPEGTKIRELGSPPDQSSDPAARRGV